MLTHAQYASKVRTVSHPVWKNILRIMEPLRSAAQGTELSAQCLAKLFQIVEKKYRHELHIASMLPPEQLKKAALFSNHNEERFRRLLHKLIRHSRMSEAQQTMLEARLGTRSGLHSAVKELHRLDMQAYDHDKMSFHLMRMDLFNALNATMSINLSKPASESLFCGFRHCDVCPRLVRPPESGVCRCEEHDYYDGNTTAYKKALAISRLKAPEHHSSALEYFQEKIYPELRRVLPERYPEGVSDDDWWYLLEAAPERLAAYDSPVQYDLAPVWEVLPRTKNLVESRSGNPLDPASVLSALNPPEANEPPAWKERRTLLNAILTRNFAPFRFELARTEAWLKIYDELFGNKKRGGARPGSGGTRPGAGRPRKHRMHG